MTKSIQQSPSPEERGRQVAELVASFCAAHLDAEHTRLCRRLAEEAPGRLKPDQFVRDDPAVWAAGLVLALGQHNFLFDPEFAPYVSSETVTEFFGVTTAAARAKGDLVRKEFFPSQLSGPEFFTEGTLNTFYRPLLQAVEDMAFAEGPIPADQGGQVYGRNPEPGSAAWGGGNLRAGRFSPGKLRRGRPPKMAAAPPPLPPPARPVEIPPGYRDFEYIDRHRPARQRFLDLTQKASRPGARPKAIAELRRLIARDPDFFDSYLLLGDLLLEADPEGPGTRAEARRLLEDAYQRALTLICDPQGRWPIRLPWGFVENRHVVRALLKRALAFWADGQIPEALDLLRKLLRSHPPDNVGARDYLLAIREGMSFEEFERRFNEGGYYGKELVVWFEERRRAYPDEFGWWAQAVGADNA